VCGVYSQFKEMGWGNVSWIHLPQEDNWWPHVDTVKNVMVV